MLLDKLSIMFDFRGGMYFTRTWRNGTDHGMQATGRFPYLKKLS
jgi:hypothetical protein